MPELSTAKESKALDLTEIREYLKWPDRLTDTGAMHLRGLIAEIERLRAELKGSDESRLLWKQSALAARQDVGESGRRIAELQYSISDLEVENGELRDKVERLCALFQEEMHREYSESDITDILERCMAGERM